MAEKKKASGQKQHKPQTQQPVAKKKTQIANSKPRDSSSKLIFGNAELFSQFLRNYMDIPDFKNIRAEDIEDVTQRYIPMFTEERNSDTVKRIKISEKNTLFFISLVEHKSKVDYNVSMQLLRYMVYIWEDYEREMEHRQKGISKTKDFRYPPILPVVYYEGSGKWNASCNMQDRILFNGAFEAFTPKFFYKLVQLNSYSIDQLVEKNDELSLLMLMNRMQSSEAFRELELPEDYLKNLSEHSTDELLDLIARVTASMLRHLNLPEEEVEEFTGQVKERKMGELFENFKDIDLPAARKKARKEGWKAGHSAGYKAGEVKGYEEGQVKGYEEGQVKGYEEGQIKGYEEGQIKGYEKGHAKGREEGHAEGREKGRAEGEERFAKLSRILMESQRMEELTNAISDSACREILYRQYHI